MNREQKVKCVEAMKGNLFASEVFVVFKNEGLKVNDFHSLRSDIRKAGGVCLVSKNRLAKLALSDNDNSEKIANFFVGPTAVVASSEGGDVVQVVKALVDFCKKSGDKAKIVGGAMGDAVFDVKDVEKLAALPSFEVLRSMLLRTLLAPATNLVSVLSAPNRDLVRVLSAYGEKKADN